MVGWLRSLWDVALLRTDAYTRFRDQHDAFFRGLVTLVAISLLSALPSAVTKTVAALGTPNQAVVDQAAMDQAIQTALQRAAPYLNQIPDAEREQILDQMQQSLDAGVKIGSDVAALPTALPRPIPALLKTIGELASSPFRRSLVPLWSAVLTTWLGYGIWVMLFAKLMGGKSTLARFFGTTALFSVPHILNVLAPVRTVGTIAGIIAFAWGAVIYVKATAESHELSIERAIFAVLLPLGVLLVVLFIVALIGLGLAGLAFSSFS